MKTILFLASLLVCHVCAYSQQCIRIAVVTVPATCTQNDGEITLNITPGSVGMGTAPFSINLSYEGLPLASYSGVSFTSITFKKGNGSLNLPGAEAFGIPSNDFLAFGGEYKVEVTSIGTFLCSKKFLFAVVKQTPDVHAILDDLQPDTGLGDGSISITPTGGVAPYSFAWTDGPTTEDRTNLTTDGYEVAITDSNGCTGRYGVVVDFTPPSSLTSGTERDLTTALYPNPSHDYFTVKVPSSKEEASIQILDYQGNTKYSIKGMEDSYQISVKNLAEGDYVVKARRGQWTSTKRIHVTK